MHWSELQSTHERRERQRHGEGLERSAPGKGGQRKSASGFDGTRRERGETRRGTMAQGSAEATQKKSELL